MISFTLHFLNGKHAHTARSHSYNFFTFSSILLTHPFLIRISVHSTFAFLDDLIPIRELFIIIHDPFPFSPLDPALAPASTPQTRPAISASIPRQPRLCEPPMPENSDTKRVTRYKDRPIGPRRRKCTQGKYFNCSAKADKLYCKFISLY